MKVFQYGGKLTETWDVSPAWIGYDRKASYTVYDAGGLYNVVYQSINLKNNEHYVIIYQLDRLTKPIELEKIKTINIAEIITVEKFRFCGKRKGSWTLPAPCFKGRKEVTYTVYESANGSYTVAGDWKELGKDERLFVIHQYGSFAEATNSEVGKMIPLILFI